MKIQYFTLPPHSIWNPCGMDIFHGICFSSYISQIFTDMDSTWIPYGLIPHGVHMESKTVGWGVGAENGGVGAENRCGGLKQVWAAENRSRGAENRCRELKTGVGAENRSRRAENEIK